MVDRVGVVARVRVDLVVRLRLREGAELADDVVRPRRRGHECARCLDRGADDREVYVCPEQVWIHERGRERVGGSKGDGAA